jgi:hypothetical protein
MKEAFCVLKTAHVPAVNPHIAFYELVWSVIFLSLRSPLYLLSANLELLVIVIRLRSHCFVLRCRR